MSFICNPACDDTQIPIYQVDCILQNNLRKGGIGRFILLNCGVTIDDITDESEWQALGTSKYTYSPEGIGAYVASEDTSERVTCAPEVVIQRISGFDFQIKQFDNTTFEDFAWQAALQGNGRNKQLLYVTCEGLLMYRANWTPGEQPGFGNITVTADRTGDVGSVESLNVQVRWDSTTEPYKGFRLSAALSSAIFK